MMRHAYACILALWPMCLAAQPFTDCQKSVQAQLHVDAGHPWRPPFGLERIGAPLMAHVTLATQQPPIQEYFLTAHRDGQEVERYRLTFSPNPSYYTGAGITPKTPVPARVFAHAALTSVPSEVRLQIQCEGRLVPLARESINWPQIEADARARPDRRINPVDLGVILPPHDVLLLASGQTATVDLAALARVRDVPNARLRAWFDGGKPVESSIPLVRQQRTTQTLQLPLTTRAAQTTLHVRLSEGARELWKKDIPTMIVAKAPVWPAFGAIETKLRYDAPIAAVDPKTGDKRPAVDYDSAWDERFKDIVVLLPNGSRFVFWRGSNYIPFWAGKFNTGVLYQWAEDCSGGMVSHPDGSQDCPEPLFDSELRYSRARIMASTASRVHVRWDYRTTDVRYETQGEPAAEDFYFYPDGFGTRVVTAPSAPGAAYQLSEFIVMMPQSAYPLEVLPSRMIEALSLDGGEERVEFPHQATMKSTADPTQWSLAPMLAPSQKPRLYRLFAHQDDPATAIYFHPSDPRGPAAYPPFYDQGLLVTPVYWGNHWPLNRGKWTVWSINDGINAGPSHSSVGGWSSKDPVTRKMRWEVEPLTSGEALIPDARGQVREVNISRFAWLIAHTDLSDELLRDWGRSFSTPPALEVVGARLDVPSYSAERRALRLVAEEESTITINLKPAERTVNPVFEIDRAPGQLVGVTLNGEALPTNAYAWDGAVLWVKASIGAQGATVGLQFQ